MRPCVQPRHVAIDDGLFVFLIKLLYFKRNLAALLRTFLEGVAAEHAYTVRQQDHSYYPRLHSI